MPDSSLRRAAIVGLGWTGQSYGLALKRAFPSVVIVGHDRDAEAAKTARKLGAVQKTHWNLISACDAAELVVLALPGREALDSLLALAGELPPETLVTDTAPLKAALVAWATENASEGLRYVPGHPLLERTPEPSADAFSGRAYCLTPAPQSDAAAVSSMVNLAERLGAKVTFLDPEEHDSLMIALEHLPALVASATVQMLQASNTRTDLHWLRQAIPAEVLSLAERVGELRGAELSAANREALRHWLERLQAGLGVLRDAVGQENGKGLAELIERVQGTGERWLPGARHDDGAVDTGPGGGTYWRRMMGMR